MINQANITQNIQNSSTNKNNTSNSNNSNSKLTFYNNSSLGKGNIPPFKPLSDSRLYEMANQYITTDESLEKFQVRLRGKYGSIYTSNRNLNSNLHVINEVRSPNNNSYNNNFKDNNNLINEVSNNNYRETINTNSNKNKKTDRLAKNIATNLEYYKMIES